MKRILYDTGQWTVARRPYKRAYKLLVVSYGEMTLDPPKNWKKIVLKFFLGNSQCFEPMFFLVENRLIRTSTVIVTYAILNCY